MEEISRLLEVHKNTVRAWIKKEGLPVCDRKRPMLVLGKALRKFIHVKKSGKRQPCQPWEFYCVGCRKPQTPKNNQVEYETLGATGRLFGVCPACGSVLNRYTSPDHLEEISQKLEVAQTGNVERISGSK